MLNPFAFGAGAPGESLGAEIITNGAFNANVSGWSPTGAGTTSWDAGRLKHTYSSPPDAAQQQNFGVITSGETYRFTAKLIPGSVPNKARLTLVFFGAGSWTFDYDVDGGDISELIVADGPHYSIQLSVPTGGSGDYSLFDDISLKEVL